MRLEQLRVRGIGPFASEQTLDLSKISGDVVAITGRNGSGKSTLSELWPLAMFREGPTRGKLSSLATSRTAYVESTVDNGQRYTIRQEVDSVTGKGEALVTQDGAPVLSDTKVSAFDAWAASHLPTQEVFFASQFGAQGAGGLLTMDKGARKAVVLRALGIEHLEGLAEQCRENKRNSEAKRNAMLAMVADIEQRIDPEDLRDDLDRVTIMIEVATKELATAEVALEAARAESQLNALARQAYETATAERNRLKGNIRQAEIELAEIEERLANNQALLADAGTIRDAVAKVEGLRAELAGIPLDTLSAKAAQAEATVGAAERDVAIGTTKCNELSSRINHLDQYVSDLAVKVQIAESGLADWSDLIATITGHLAIVQSHLDTARGMQLSDNDRRIDFLRGELTDIGAGCTDAQGVAGRAIAHDDEVVAAKTAVPERIWDLEARLSALSREHAQAVQTQAECQRVADRRPELDRMQMERAELSRALDVAGTESESAQARLTEASREAGLVGKELAAALNLKSHITTEIDTLQPVAKRLERLAQAEARVAELTGSRAERLARIEALGKELRESPDPSPPCAAPALAPFIADTERIRFSLGDHKAEAMRIHSEIVQAEQRAIRLKTALAELAVVDSDLSDWTRLAHDLGRDGLQAVEIDAAGPVITELSNDLLHQAFGNRFTISFETTRPSADGKREIEDFRISVLDTLNGREADAKTFSGGEKVILSEAIALALTMLACQRSGIERPTIIRDESGAALDGENGQRYVAMLRRAAKIVGADKVLFISHDPATWDLADARIVVADGRILAE